MKNLLLLITTFISLLSKGQCDYTNQMPSTVLSNKNVCFTEDVTITHGSIVNYGTITISDNIKVTFNGALQNYSSGKFKLMGCGAKINVITFGGVWQNIDIERYCSSGSCNDVSINSGGPVDLGYFKTAGSASYVDVECQEPLPVNLLYYICLKKEIKWSTASEINNDYFTIEYSTDGVNWKSRGVITGQGNSSEINKYSNPVTQNGYYRVTQTDYDGTTEELGVLKCGNITDVNLLITYDLLGQVVGNDTKGLVIELYSDGTTKKVVR